MDNEQMDLYTPGSAPSADKSDKNRKILPFVIWILVAITLAIGTYFLTTTLFTRIQIIGSSMEPTLQSQDDVLVFETKKIDYDDIIVFYYPELQENLIKRVIGKEGDVIKCVFDEPNKCFHLYRNGELLSEEHIKSPMVGTGGFRETETVVPKGKLYVLGDNRNGSLDSFDNILADKNKIIGKVILRISDNSFRKIS